MPYIDALTSLQIITQVDGLDIEWTRRESARGGGGSVGTRFTGQMDESGEGKPGTG